MTDQRKKEIALAVMEAIEKEGLLKKEAAWYFNHHTNYITWLQNEKYWTSIGLSIWERWETWMLTNDKITAFIMPDGETRKDPLPERKKEMQTTVADKVTPAAEPGEFSLEAAQDKTIASSAGRPSRNDGGRTKKEKNGKSVKLVINQQEMADMRQEIAFLKDKVAEQEKIDVNEALSLKIATLEQRFEAHLILFEKRMDALKVMIEAIKEVPVLEPHKTSIVFFQRNYPKP